MNQATKGLSMSSVKPRRSGWGCKRLVCEVSDATRSPAAETSEQ